MECQIEGCHNKAVSFDALNGIHQGTYINGVFGHCKHHSSEHLVEAKNRRKDQLAKDNNNVNPYMEVQRVKYGKAAG